MWDLARAWAELRVYLVSGLAIAFLVACLVLGWREGVAKREAASLHAEIYAEETGYVARLATCNAGASGLRAALGRQDAAVGRLVEERAALKAEGERRLAVERQKLRAAERRLLGARRAVANPGETQCEAAERLIMERVG